MSSFPAELQSFIESFADQKKVMDTLILQAARLNKLEQVRLLLKAGADANARDDSGFTPLSYATCEGNERLVRLLINYNANLHIIDGFGQTLLECATGEKIIKILRDRGVKDKLEYPHP